MKTLAQIRNATYPFPVYEAHFSDGTYVRLSFFTPKGKPIDASRGRQLVESLTGWTVTHLPTLCRIEPGLMTGKRLVRGFIEHDVPGQPWVRFLDAHFAPYAVETPKAKRVTAKVVLAALADLLAAIDGQGPADAVVKARELIAA